MGATGASWLKSKSSRMAKVLNATRTGDHNALNDAKAQAELFRLIMALRAGHPL